MLHVHVNLHLKDLFHTREYNVTTFKTCAINIKDTSIVHSNILVPIEKHNERHSC